MATIYNLVVNCQVRFAVEDTNTGWTATALENPGHRWGLVRRLSDSIMAGTTEGGFELRDVTVLGSAFETGEE